MRIEEKTGHFAKIAKEFGVTDEAGNPVKAVEVGVTVVHGPWKLMTKDQIAQVTGVVTPSMLNATGTEKDKAGKPVYKFQGNGWSPEALVGDILLQDVENPPDRWACSPELFGGTGWTGIVHGDLSVTYAKPGKATLAMELLEGTMVVSREGPRTVGAGHYLAVSKADKVDFYVWTPDVVKNYVREYVR